jgi:hypothetical protein
MLDAREAPDRVLASGAAMGITLADIDEVALIKALEYQRTNTRRVVVIRLILFPRIELIRRQSG